MTLIEVPLLDDVDLDLRSDLHRPCCMVDEFICGTPYHPELDVTLADGEPCPTCQEIEQGMTCRGVSRMQPEHQHCPISRRICPFTTDGRRVVGR